MVRTCGDGSLTTAFKSARTCATVSQRRLNATTQVSCLTHVDILGEIFLTMSQLRNSRATSNLDHDVA